MCPSRSKTRSFEWEKAKSLAPLVEASQIPGSHQKVLTARTASVITQTAAWRARGKTPACVISSGSRDSSRAPPPIDLHGSPRRKEKRYAKIAAGAAIIADVRWTNTERLRSVVEQIHRTRP